MKITRDMPSFEGVAEGQTATCRLPIGLTYNQLGLVFGGTTFEPDDMTEIRLVANGKTIQRWNGTHLDKVNQFEGRAAATTKDVLFLDCERYGLRTKLGQELTALPSGAANNPVPIRTLQLEVDISGSTAPTLSALGFQSAARDLKGQMQPVKQVRKFNYTPSGTGVFEIADLPRVGEINRIVMVTTDTIDDVEIEVDGYTMFQRTTAENEAAQIDGGRTPQSNYWIIDTTEEGNGGETIRLNGVQDFRLKVNYSAVAGSTTVYVEYLDPIRN